MTKIVNQNAIFSFFLAIFLITAPFLVFGQAVQNFIPCGTEVYPDGATLGTGSGVKYVGGTVSNPCGFQHIITLINKIANYLIVLGAAVSALAFAWAGFLMMTAGGEMGKIEHAKEIFGKVLVGFLIMLSAWLIVHAIDAGLIDAGFISRSTLKPI
ncbi:MAG: pilin [Patescibacteria group bacterium]